MEKKTHDGVVVNGGNDGVVGLNAKMNKLIIDTDPGIDDSMAILMAFQQPEVEIMAEGSPGPLKGGRPRVADFAHGSDGMGNIFLPPPNKKKSDKSASEFLVEKVSEYPGEVSIYGDPEAADVVFTSGANIVVVGINITTQVQMTDDDLLKLKQSNGKYAQLLSDMCKFYRDWHVKSDGVYVLVPGIFLHDPVSFVALVRPDLFTYKKGVVRVETQGICVGHTLLDQGLKKNFTKSKLIIYSNRSAVIVANVNAINWCRWNGGNPWTGYSLVSAAWTVNVDEVLSYVKTMLMKP
ncbi:Uridine nucleosidase 1 [Hibiscus syriacus]|uniref:Uridine nucleosidase 1 n=1 Tax=Hibiscus syriacus TaxID=106335 RepID=A0A6A2XT43_HIBSY|nr:Uridine nucleosidase 1 [Hibiscus syriacus]